MTRYKKIVLIFAFFVIAPAFFAVIFSLKFTQSSPEGKRDADWFNSTDKATIQWAETTTEKQHHWRKNVDAYNVVLITVNLLRADHLSVYGYGRDTTPAMNTLAQESFVFSNMFTNADYTMPNMMSIITSLFPAAHGVFDAYKDVLTANVRTLAEILKSSGYASSWYALQMPHLDTNVGFGRGYDQITQLAKDYSNVEHMTDWINKNRDKPFFLGINSRSIHPPYMPPPQLKDRFFAGGKKGNIATTEAEFRKAWYKKILELMETPDSCMWEVIDEDVISQNSAIFDGEYQEEKLFRIQELIPETKKIRFGFTHMMTFTSMIDPNDRENLDYAVSLYDACVLGIDQMLVKPIITALQDAGVYEKTIIIITGDHGESLGEHNYVGHNLNFYEQLIHVPLILRHPDIKERINIAGLVQSVDIMPTILDLLGISQPYHTQGKSMVPLLEDHSAEPVNTYVFGQKRKQAFIRSKKWKLIVNLQRDKEQEMCSWATLYNIADDPEERKNVCEDEREILRQMMVTLLDHQENTPRYIDKHYQFLPGIDEKTRKRIRETGYW